MSKEGSKISLGIAASWIIGVLFLLAGLKFIIDGSLQTGLPLLLASLIILPPITDFFKKNFNIELTGGLKLVLVIILLMLTAIPNQQFNLIGNIIGIQEPDIVDTETQPEIEEEIKTLTKSATLSIDKVQVQAATLYPARITVTNTGEVPIVPKFDIYVYKGNTEICSGSPSYNEYGVVYIGESKTKEIGIMGCFLDEDGTYFIHIDLLDSDYNILDTEFNNFDVNYWSNFGFKLYNS